MHEVEITHLDQVKEAVQLHNAANRRDGKFKSEFLIKDKGDGYVVFDYECVFTRTFPAFATASTTEDLNRLKLLRECRGIIFDKETGAVLARRYHKFFNVNERPETAARQIDMGRPHVILEKLDGSLCSPFRLDGRLRFGSKRGLTPLADAIEAHIARVQGPESDYHGFCNHWIDQACTPIFEWCSPENLIVLRYHEAALVLTGIRHNRSGRYVLFDEMQQSAAVYHVPCVQPLVRHAGDIVRQDDETEIAELIRFVRQQRGQEGFVLRFDCGEMYKIKTEWYLSHGHRLDFDDEAAVLSLILERELDDWMGTLEEPARARLRRFSETTLHALDESFDSMIRQTRELHAELLGQRKLFFRRILTLQGTLEFHMLTQLWNALSQENEVGVSAAPTSGSTSTSPAGAPESLQQEAELVLATDHPSSLHALLDAGLRSFLKKKKKDLGEVRRLLGGWRWCGIDTDPVQDNVPGWGEFGLHTLVGAPIVSEPPKPRRAPKENRKKTGPVQSKKKAPAKQAQGASLSEFEAFLTQMRELTTNSAQPALSKKERKKLKKNQN